MKIFFKLTMLFTILAIFQNIYSSVVDIDNTTLFKVKATLDLVAYPDSQKEISSNSKVSENIGVFLMRGLTIGVHIGDQFLENILSESLVQTLGFGDVCYSVFSVFKKLGHITFTNEVVLEVTFYLVRAPKFMYAGGLVSTSKPIFVATKNLESFKIVEKNYLSTCSETRMIVQQVPVAYTMVQQVPTNSESVAFGGTVVR